LKKRRKKSCTECGQSRWGLVRHYWGLSAFCSRTCLSKFKSRLEAKRKFLLWLYADP
jgi:hypothetical protein